jgi:hypothetical protein
MARQRETNYRALKRAYVLGVRFRDCFGKVRWLRGWDAVQEVTT